MQAFDDYLMKTQKGYQGQGWEVVSQRHTLALQLQIAATDQGTLEPATVKTKNNEIECFQLQRYSLKKSYKRIFQC
jgi:hypothetical protein